MLSRGAIANLLFGSISIASLSIYICVIHASVTPSQRDFYCTDQSINYTSGYLTGQETVTMGAAAGVGVVMVLFTVAINEIICHIAKVNKPVSFSDPQYASCLCCCCQTSGFAQCSISILKILLLAILGGLVNESFTVTVKKTIGRHRPYFLSTCELTPQVQAACNSGIRTQVSMCNRDTPTVRKHLLEAMQSFPSGHSSHSMYMSIFAALYLQSRFPFTKASAIKWLLQCAYLLWGCFVCASRVSDFRHHWSDVIAGGLLGSAVGLLVCLHLRPSYLDHCCRSIENIDG